MQLRKATAGAAAGLAMVTGGALVAQTVTVSTRLESNLRGSRHAASGRDSQRLGFPEGTAALSWLRGLLRERAAAGVILFGANVRAPGQLRALTGGARRVRGAAIVSVDQEGGSVRRLPWLGPSAQPAQRPRPRPPRGGRRARGLRRAGVNLNLAPVADVAVGPSAMRSRAFRGGPASVASLTAAAVRGYAAGGIGSTAKHFPGFWRARANTDQRAVTIGASRRALEGDLRPFGAAIRAGVPAVMVSHAVYPAYDQGRIASRSPVLLRLLAGPPRFV